MHRVHRLISAVRGWPLARQLAAAGGLVVLLVGLIVVLTHASSHRPVALPPTPPSPAATKALPSAATTARVTARHSPKPTHKPGPSKSAATKFRCDAPSTSSGGLAAIHICIPSIDVDAQMITTGLNADRTIQVPTLAQVGLASWYKYSPAPGAVGPSIILGHVDSAQYGKGVFFDLGSLKVGARVRIERADLMIATYRIDKVAQYAKSSFPSQLVYGDTAEPTVRLITCGGTFDPSAGSYEDNIVAFGTLLSLRHA